MNRSKSTPTPFKALFKGIALLFLAVCCFLLSPALTTAFQHSPETASVLKQTQEKAQDVWLASEPINASHGVLHEAEVSLLPLVFAFLALFFFPDLQLRKAAYSCAPPKLFDYFRILPNAP